MSLATLSTSDLILRVFVDGIPILPEFSNQIRRVEVESQVNLPSSCEIEFTDPDLLIPVECGLEIGNFVEVRAVTGDDAAGLFHVLATQNPIEQEGTYPLPEAQLDRFFYKLVIPSPDDDLLAGIVNRADQIWIDDRIVDHQTCIVLVCRVISRCRLCFDKVNRCNSRVTQIVKDRDRC